ncbi:hypothetical protein BUALT_Bualt12G0019400 [Buddleja alternifolia]|uniref:Glycosyltransferase N-terminal domain-containing protein n=1 Tax=Buddleja alternifolia TaxID=168488 RepID=A0AAV6WU89_9LAMI|nr:hypothetical protein BUALT_Bualt12G0019400 [Buddleja alternifolia]
MVPLPAQGHLNQLLHLSRLVSAHDIPVHFVGTTTHNRQAKLRVHGWDPLSISNFKSHDFPLHTFSNPPPDPNSSTKFPVQIIPSLKSTTNLRKPIYNLVEKLSATVGKIVVIYDSLMPYVVQDISSIPNAESYCFQSISAFSLYSFYWEGKGKPILATEAEIIRQVPSIEECVPPELLEFSKIQEDAPKFNSGDIYNTSRVIEGLYVDLLAKEKTTGTDKIWAIGPFNPVSAPGKRDLTVRHKYLDWLDKLELNSVIFISFGSTSSLSDEQINEIAFGLERSEVKFIWVLRDADKGDIFAVKDWERRDEVISSVRVEKAVRTLMRSAEGDEIRKIAAKLGDALKKSLMEGGETRKEMDSFVAHITR